MITHIPWRVVRWHILSDRIMPDECWRCGRGKQGRKLERRQETGIRRSPENQEGRLENECKELLWYEAFAEAVLECQGGGS